MSVTTKSLSSPILANKMRVNHFVFFSTLLIVVIIGSVILAFTKIDISSQSKGITRSIQESTYVSSLQNGFINSHNIVPNKNVQKGDTLLILSQDRIQSQEIGQDSLLHDKQAYLKDLEFLIASKKDSLTTYLGITLLNDYNNQVLDLKNRVSLAQKPYPLESNLFY